MAAKDIRRFLLVGIVLPFLGLELRGDIDPQNMSRDEMVKAAEGLIITNYYVNRWLRAPDIKGQSLDGKDAELIPKPGFVDVHFFLASWCIPCQRLTKKIKSIVAHYAPYNVRFNFIFAHDRAEDAGLFAKAYSIDHGILANAQILKNFHNPPLPTIYMSDKNGWFLSRYVNPSDADLKNFDNLLDKLVTF